MRKIQLIITAAVFVVVGCKEKTKPTDKFNPNMPVSVDITIAELQKVDKPIEVNGTVLANDYVELHPEVNGRITFLQIQEGKMVKAGTVLAKLNDADLQAQLEKLNVQLALANINEQRNKQLLSIRGINQSDYDLSLQQVRSLKADMAYTQSLIEKTIIKAPFNGQVGLRQVSVGAYINTSNTIATIQKIDQLKMDFTLPEIYGDYVKIGKSIKMTTIGNEQKPIIATITAIEPQIIATTRNIKVRASFKGKVLPGAYAKVFLGENTTKPSIMVPSNIIIPDSKAKQVVVVRNGEAKFVSVETGYRTISSVEITKGLQVGDSVIVAGMLFVKDGAKLKIGKTLSNIDITK